MQYQLHDMDLQQLVAQLQFGDMDARRAAAGQVRALARSSAEARTLIAEAGALPLLLGLLDADEPRVQEASGLAILNLCIKNACNKAAVMEAGAVPRLVHLLRPEAPLTTREAAAAVLLCLAADNDPTKAAIGAAGAIPLLGQLLTAGSLQGTKDAVHALYNLVAYDGNRGRILRARVVPGLVAVLKGGYATPEAEKVVAILGILAGLEEGRGALSEHEDTLRALVKVLEAGSLRGKELALASLLPLCVHSKACRVAVVERGAGDALLALSLTGEPKLREKAYQLLACLGGKKRGEKPTSAPMVMLSRSSSAREISPDSGSRSGSGSSEDERSAKDVVRHMVWQSMQKTMTNIRRRARLPSEDFSPSLSPSGSPRSRSPLSPSLMPGSPSSAPELSEESS
eukprot:SM000007S20898  [mRNA]  locus=s7:822065:824105:+ [translate_table: standard]